MPQTITNTDSETGAAVKWFQVDSDTPNDPKVKAAIRRGLPNPAAGQAAAGALFLLWCYVANHGGMGPGEGVDGAGDPLPLSEMADECLFDSVDELKGFLAFLADKRHIDPEAWAAGWVRLPAMAKRADSYAKSKGRAPAGPKRVDAGENSPGLFDTGENPPLQDNTNPTIPAHQITTPEALVAVWNETRKPGPKLQQLTAERRRAYARALADQPDLAKWAKVIAWVNTQAWCNAGGTGTHANYRMDLDSLSRPGKLQQTFERMVADQLPRAKPAIRAVAGGGRTVVTPGKYGGGGEDE